MLAKKHRGTPQWRKARAMDFSISNREVFLFNMPGERLKWLSKKRGRVVSSKLKEEKSGVHVSESSNGRDNWLHKATVFCVAPRRGNLEPKRFVIMQARSQSVSLWWNETRKYLALCQFYFRSHSHSLNRWGNKEGKQSAEASLIIYFPSLCWVITLDTGSAISW